MVSSLQEATLVSHFGLKITLIRIYAEMLQFEGQAAFKL